MSSEAPERIWAYRDGQNNRRWTDTAGIMMETGYVRADKLEELAAENERLRKDCYSYEKTMQAIAALEAEDKTALAEKDKEIEALEAAAPAALEPTEPATNVEPVAWLMNGKGENWEERNVVTFDKETADMKAATEWWTVEPLYTRPPESRLREALEHVTELLVDTWNTKMEGDPERQIAVREARAALAQEGGR